MHLELPTPSLVLLIGLSGSGKSTFAAAHFEPSEIVSSDSPSFLFLAALRRRLPNAVAPRRGGMAALFVGGRLRRGQTTVVDATNVQATNRRAFMHEARRHGVPAVGIVFNLPTDVVLANNRRRPRRQVPEALIYAQLEALRESLDQLPGEGYAQLVMLGSTADADALSVSRMDST